MKSKNRNRRYKAPSRLGFTKGLVISWTDKNPLDDTSEVLPGSVTHRNAIHRLHADEIFFEAKKIMMWTTPHMWKITITVVFDYGNSVQRESREIKAFCTLGEIDDACNGEIVDCMRHGDKDKYIHTEFVVECVGNHDVIDFSVDSELRRALV